MRCPRCLLVQPDGQPYCIQCAMPFPGRMEVIPDEELPVGPIAVSRAGWRAVAIGAGVALPVVALPFFGLLMLLLHPLLTIVHELGHTAFAWLFGYPTIPAFDFVYGGGIAISTGRQTGLLILIYVIFAGLFYYYRANRLTLGVLGGLVVLHALFAFTRWHELPILFMGHGVELTFCTIFLYRAISGTSLVHEFERPIYGFLGFFIQFYDVKFAFQLMTSREHQQLYGDAKGGGHWMDFSRISNEFFHGQFVPVVLFFFLCCFLPPVLAFCLHRFRNAVFGVAERLLDPRPDAV
jgi:hypothetical protein